MNFSNEDDLFGRTGAALLIIGGAMYYYQNGALPGLAAVGIGPLLLFTKDPSRPPIDVDITNTANITGTTCGGKVDKTKLFAEWQAFLAKYAQEYANIVQEYKQYGEYSKEWFTTPQKTYSGESFTPQKFYQAREYQNQVAASGAHPISIVAAYKHIVAYPPK